DLGGEQLLVEAAIAGTGQGGDPGRADAAKGRAEPDVGDVVVQDADAGIGAQGRRPAMLIAGLAAPADRRPGAERLRRRQRPDRRRRVVGDQRELGAVAGDIAADAITPFELPGDVVLVPAEPAGLDVAA